jgi:DNA-binding NtrC family response regulator
MKRTGIPSPSDAVVLPLGTTLEHGERELIQRTLESVKNNKTRAAAILGTTPKTLHNKYRGGGARRPVRPGVGNTARRAKFTGTGKE